MRTAFFIKNGRISFFLIIFLVFVSCRNSSPEIKKADPILFELKASLESLSQIWYPRTMDTIEGGFYPDFNYRWELEGEQTKMLVTQARHLWTTSSLYAYYKDPRYLKMAKHGFEYLSTKMWDTNHGGFHTFLKPVEGIYTPQGSTKSTYANAFAIYGLANYYKVSGDTAALNLAKKTFQWIDQKAYDPLYKGYFDVLQLDGTNMLLLEENDKDYDNWIRRNWKDQNSSIHLMEAFSALYEVWPDKHLGERLTELQLLIRDTITSSKGYLYLHLERDWTPVILKDSSETYRQENFALDHVSFGHDVETGFLLLEASHALKLQHDSITPLKAKKMIDHGIDKGWDLKLGGFFDGGYYLDDSDECTILNRAKIWWTQAEGLNALMLMASLYPEEKRYRRLFEAQWSYIKKELMDQTYGGWYGEGVEGNEQIRLEPKAHIWKVNYHNIRALINTIEMLEGTYVLVPEK
ncbi:MAG: AGE family epimerase/isomerase [Eudoraea sp.]